MTRDEEPVTGEERIQMKFEECFYCYCRSQRGVATKKRRAVICAPQMGPLFHGGAVLRRHWGAFCLQHARQIGAIERTLSQMVSRPKSRRPSGERKGIHAKAWLARGGRLALVSRART